MKALHEFLLLLWTTWSCVIAAIYSVLGIQPGSCGKDVCQAAKRDVGTKAAAPPCSGHQQPSAVKSAARQFWVDTTEHFAIAEQRAAFEQQFRSLGYASYAVPGGLQELRSSQFPQLQGLTYLDHAATTLYSAHQLAAAHAELSQQLFANPHSQLGSGLDATPAAVEQLRLLTLRMLNAPADEYEVILTSGATSALKLAGEAFPWTAGTSCCAYTTANHNSALGVRQLAAAAGAAVQPVDLQQLLQQARDGGGCCEQFQQQQQQQWQEQQEEQEGDGVVHSLLVVPAECNFSGSRCDPQLLHRLWQQQQQQQVLDDQQLADMQGDLQGQYQQQQPQQQQQQRWWLLADAAKACCAHPPDCSDCIIDMLALSYYKIFGHPTGLGALLVRRSLLPLLLRGKAYFGGGTVEVAVAQELTVVRRQGAAGLEDGTLPFTSIAAARHGFEQLMQLSSSSSAAVAQPHLAAGVSSSSNSTLQPSAQQQQQQRQQCVRLQDSFGRIDRHTSCLTWHLMQQLLALRHSNGQRAAVLYCEPAVLELLLQQQQLSEQRSVRCQAMPLQPPDSSSSGSNSRACTLKDAPHAAAAAAAADAGVLAAFQLLQGPVVCFNLVRADGSWVGHREVAKLALIHGICIRTGCFCNPGACARYLQLSAEDMLAHHAAGHVCWDDHDVLDGKPTGAVRASFGYMSSYDDVALLLLFIRKFFLDTGGNSAAAAAAALAPLAAASAAAIPEQLSSGTADCSANAAAVNGWHQVGGQTAAAAAVTAAESAAGTGCLSALYLYPIKSCAPQAVTSWPLGPNGLLYDREWALVGPDGSVIIQKGLPGLTQLQPEVDLAAGVMRVTAPGVHQQLLVQLQQQQQEKGEEQQRMVQPPPQQGAEQQRDEGIQQQQQQQLVKVCGDTVCSQVVASAVTVANAAETDREAAAAAAAVDRAVTYDAQAWFSAVLGVPCKLVQQLGNSRAVKRNGTKHPQHLMQQLLPLPQQQDGNGDASSSRSISSSSSSSGQTSGQTLGFANEGQYLLVNQASVDAVGQQLAAAAAGPLDSSSSTSNHRIHAAAKLDALRFRPNLVVEGFAPWAEDSWRSIVVGGTGISTHSITNSSSSCCSAADDGAEALVVLGVVGACGRCDMIRIDQVTGRRHDGQLLSLLARQRRQRGKLNFGVLLAHETPATEPATCCCTAVGASMQDVRWLHVGDVVGVN